MNVNDLMCDSGPLLPYLLLVTQLCTETVEQVAKEFGQRCPCRRVVLALILFILVRPYNELFSDHIVLLNSMLAHIRMPPLAMTLRRRDWSSEAVWWFYFCQHHF